MMDFRQQGFFSVYTASTTTCELLLRHRESEDRVFFSKVSWDQKLGNELKLSEACLMLNWTGICFNFVHLPFFFDTKIYKPYYCYVMLSIFLYLHLNHIHIHASELNISYPLWICILKKKIPLSLHLSNIKSSDFLSCHPSSQNPSPPWPYWRSSNSF